MFEFLKKLVTKKPKPKKIVAKPAPKPKPNKVLENDLININDPSSEDGAIQKKKGFFNFTEKIKEGLAKTREKLTTPLSELFSSQTINESFYDELEMILLTSDVGISATDYLIQRVKDTVTKNNIVEPQELKSILKNELV